MREMRRHTEFWWGNLYENVKFKDQERNEMITLRWVLVIL
jgi:hypothetical protein